jgi:translation elongation factor EF-G
VNEEVFNLELRKFLKRFGITAQREIEKGVAAGLEDGTLSGYEVLAVHATLTIPGVLPEFRIDGEIALAGPDGGGPDQTAWVAPL